MSRHDNQKIKLLLTVPHLSSTASPYREMMALARNLPKDYFQITVCSLRNDGLAETGPLLEKLGCRVFIARYRLRGRRYSHWRSFFKDQKIIAHYGPFDIQHSLDFSASPLEAIFSKRHSRNFIFSQRSLQGNATGLRLKIWLGKKIVALSDAVVQFMTGLGADSKKVEKIPLGIEQDSANPSEQATKTGPISVLSVGHIQRGKRHQDAVRVLAQIIPEIPDLSLLIAGDIYDSNYFQELQEIARSLGMAQRVQFLGVRDDVLALMKTSAALLLCSESESFGWVILEAMSVGLPVVASDSGGPGEIITDGVTGALVRVGDIDGYTRALQKIILEPEWAALLSKNAWDLVSTKYSAAEMVARHAEMYRQLAEGSRRSKISLG
jgi:glycosyltransferase involved in cell wall biosynthesis